MTIKDILNKELDYQQKQLKLIPSENYTSAEVMNAVGSIFMNKYAEGYPGKRYYQGNKNIDKVERLCRKNALAAFNLSEDEWHVNVQVTTGSYANMAVYNTVLEPGDKIMGMLLTHGGHLSHGWRLPNGKPVSFTSKIFQPNFYGVEKDTYLFDYNKIEEQVKKVEPKLLISGGTAYPRDLDHEKLAEIAHQNGALYLADIAHEAGLVAAGVHPTPFKDADFVTMTTRKTLRGPIGSLVFCRKEYADQLDRAVFPGMQGGPMIHSIAGIAVALEESMKPEFKQYSQQVINNAKALAEALDEKGFNLITGGTDKHLLLIDIRNKQPEGYTAAEILEATDIITNKNTIPFDESSSPWRPSGIRIGTPSVTTRGMKESEMVKIAELIEQTLNTIEVKPKTKKKELREILKNSSELKTIKASVHELTAKFPIYQDLDY